MKPNEITVGDWVSYSMSLDNDNMFEDNIQITNIYGNEVNCNVEYDTVISGYLISHLTPIPLTEEILKKNGFKHTCGTYSWRKDGFCLHCELQGEPPYSIEIARKIGVTVYVHELQHALRLCGLNELADNFSIK